MPEIKITTDNGEEIVPVEAGNPSTTIPDGVFLVEKVAQMFDLKPSEVSKYKSKLNTLIEYAKLKTEDHSASGLKWTIRSLGTKLGTPPLGEKLLPYLTRYAHLYLESRNLNKEMERYHDVNS